MCVCVRGQGAGGGGRGGPTSFITCFPSFPSFTNFTSFTRGGRGGAGGRVADVNVDCVYALRATVSAVGEAYGSNLPRPQHIKPPRGIARACV